MHTELNEAASVNEEAEFTTLGLSEAMALAIQTHRNGHLAEAETLYGYILQAAPDHPPALKGLGMLLNQGGHCHAALLAMQASVALAPDAEGYFALGDMLLQQNRIAQAVVEFLNALALEPDNAAYWNVLGEALQRQKRYEEAATAYQHAIALYPGFVDAFCNLGNVLSEQGHIAKAAECYCQAIVAAPRRSNSRTLLGIGYAVLGRTEEAAAVYRQWLRDEPENPTAAHLYAAFSGEEIPERAANRYLEAIFDEFAPTFDEQLLGSLCYQGPTLIEAALAKALVPTKTLRGLDGGCGTGLCGTVIEPYVNHLTGVDLSSKMLALAQQRGLYDELKKAELTDYLNEQIETFDLIVMTDTLIYFGALENVLKAAYHALRTQGVFIFTVEDAPRPNVHRAFSLNGQGRYCHDRDYILATLTACGFALVAESSNTLRLELGKPVAGTVVTALKPA